jgi:hypothetical protein
MHAPEQQPLMFPYDAVAHGLVDPAHLTSDQAFGGVEIFRAWDTDIRTDELSGRVYVNSAVGWQEAPAGLVIERWTQYKDGSAASHLTFVHATEGLRILAYREDGSLPYDVTARIKAEGTSRAEAMTYLEPPAEPIPLRAHIGRRKEQARPESRIRRVLRAAAQIATEAFIKQPTGRHHRPESRFA